MFGDATPHQFEDYVDIMSDPDYVDIVTEQIDWRDETEELAKMVRAQRSYICSAMQNKQIVQQDSFTRELPRT